MHIKVFVSKSAAKKKNPVQTNVVATVKNGDKFSVKSPFTWKQRRIGTSDTLEVISYVKGSDQIQLELIGEHGLKVFTVELENFLAKLNKLKKIT
jgi:hypothetical protein